MITPLIESLQNDLKEGLPIETFVSAEILQDLLNAALRLAAIENAGDEEVELMLKTIGGDASDSEKTNAFLWLRWIFKSRNATIADLLAKEKEQSLVIGDLSMLVRRLCRVIDKVNPTLQTLFQARDYLRRKGLQGSILRQDKHTESEVEGG